MRRVSKSSNRGSTIASVMAVSCEPNIAHTNPPQQFGVCDPKTMTNIANTTPPNTTASTSGRQRYRLEHRCKSTDDRRWSSSDNRKISDASSCPSSVLSDRSNSNRTTVKGSPPNKERPHRAHCQRFNQGNSSLSHDNTSSPHSRHTTHNNRSSHKNESCSSKSSGSTSGACSRLSCSDDGDGSSSSSTNDDHLPYPGFPEVALKYLTQDARPRNWCLMLITNPYPF